MAEFKLGRIRFVWKGDWAASTTYVKDDVVKYGGRTYICQIGHTSAANFYTDKDFVPTKWNQMTDGQEWKGDWATSTFYSENDVVKYGGLLYIAVNSHTSAATTALGLEANTSDWELYAEGFDWKGDWTTATRYKKNDLVRYGGYTYVCNDYHTSAATTAEGLEADQSKWDTFNPGIEYKGAWSASSVRYKINDVVKYGAGLYICTTEHTSAGTFAAEESNWEVFVKGFEFENDWNGATTYQPGDVVRYGGNQYISKTNHVSATVPNLDSTNWDLFAEGFNWASAWSFDNNYKIGDVVSVNGQSFVALQNINQVTLTVTAANAINNQFAVTSTSTIAVGMMVRFSGSTFGDVGVGDNYYVKQITSGTTFTVAITPGGAEMQPATAAGSMTAKFVAHPNNTTYWSVLNKGIQWRGTWAEGTEYEVGDAILYGANSYICILKHKAEQDDGSTIRAEGGGAPDSRPDQDVSGTYWNVLAVGSETSVLTTRGDMVYYGDVGPTRLPIGLEGQVLRVSDDFIPEWVTLGGQDYTYYVATNGTDLPAPVHGLSFDKPWKTIRYACEQVERGPRNSNAKFLLEMNRAFIQREVTEWILWQIDNAAVGSIWEGFTFEDYKCERDTGLVVDAVMHDISHGGNVKSRGAALAYVNALLDSPGTYVRLSEEADNDVAAFNYMLTVVEKVLAQEAPTVNYQVLNGDNSTAIVEQFFDATKSAEAGVMTHITTLVGIITDALTAGVADDIPERYSPNNLIRIATGDYREVLPIIVPEQTCVIGAELRSTSAGPRVGTTAKEDAKYSIAALGRMEAIVGDIITGGDVTETSGNSEVQSAEFPFADTPQVTVAERLVRTMQQRIDWKLGTLNLAYTTDPVGYNSSYLVGYGDARKLVKENKTFLQEEVKAWLITNYPNLKYSKTKCYQDVGYLIDGLVYDLTYGGNAASVQAGLAYYEGVGSSLYIDSTEKSATLAAYEFLKTRIETVANNTGFTALNDQIVQYRDTAGSAGAITALGNNMDDIIEIITTGPSAVGTTVTLADPAATNGVSSTTALISAYSTLTSAVPTIQVDTIDYINSTYGSFIYDSAKCRRDTGIIIDGVYYDVALGTNYNAVTNGRSYRRSMASEVIASQLEQTLGAIAYTKTQAADSVDTNATALSRSNAAFDEILDIIENGVAAADALTWSDPGVDANKRYAREQLQTNRAFIISELSNWINTNYSALWASLGAEGQATCQRDTGYVIDAISYDIQYGGNTATRVAAQAYFEGSVSVLPASQQAETSAAFTQLGVICASVVQETYGGQDTSGTAATGTEGTQCTDLIAIITDVIDADSLSGLPAASNPSISWAAAGIQTAVGQLNTDKTDIVAATLQYITNTFSSLVYDHSKCSRDVATIIKAVGYDFQLNSNWQTTKAAYAYLRETAQEVYQLNQKTATRGALEFVRTQAVANVGGDSTAIARINALMELLDDIIYSGSNEGSVCATEERNDHYAVLQLERNRDYIVAEINAYIADTFNDTVTATTASTKAITISDTSWLVRGAAVRFTGTVIGGLETGVTYYVQKILSATTFTVSSTRFAADIDQFAVEDGSGSMGVVLHFNADLCTRDVNEYISSLKYDIKYPGNYKSLLSARYYANSVLGSLEEDMFYLRDACGLRDMTLSGLSGDLTPENEYGTSRVTAGAYASLDPGWGPDDFRAWIITRSPYVQGLTTFGNAAIGQKIDGALHNGGNDSIVSNDFTQVISDGIGAWVANNGRAELVSVFTYYSHIGYLSTEGGRIRGTNGNNSYGDFGSVAEGFDATETPNTAVVDNRFQFVSTVDIVNNDGDEMLNYEFENAGIDYTEATWTMTGGGISAVTEADEFRDGGVYQVRLLDFGNDSSGQFGGEGYTTNSNTAQGGGSTFVTLAATDDELSTAYIGMKVILTAGAGAGQYGIITTYNSGTKRADVVRESDGVAGWDHFVPGRDIAVPDASTTYTVEPRITFAAPAFTSVQQTLPTSAAWTAATYGETAAIYTAVTGEYSGTGGKGSTFDVTRNGWKYIVSVNAGGTDYTRLETITILGTDLGGLTPENDLVLTITSVDSETGAVTVFDQDGYGIGGRFVAVRGTSTTAGAYSDDGETWSASTMPSGTWTGVAAGLIEDGSTLIKVSRFVAIGTGTSAAWSADGINWNASVMPTSATWASVVYGEGKFVAIASDSTTVAISLDGEVWDITGTLTATGFADITYGKGMFVAVKTASNIVARSNDGETWTDETLPATTNWSSVAWGNGRFVAISPSSNSGAFSLDGETWSAMTLGPIDGSTISPSAGYQTVRYGQGLFMATTYITGFGDYAYVATSEDGIIWTVRGVDGKVNSTAGFDAIAFGNPQRIPMWIVLDKDTSNEAVKISAGARAKGRAYVAETKIYKITILEPGSGYTSAPTMTITDPTNLYEAPFAVRIGNGTLANPTFLNRGSGYATSGAEINTGDGYADFYQTGGFIAVRRLSARPVPGSNVVFGGLPNRTFKLVNVITFLGSQDGSYTAFLQVSPVLEVSEAFEHLDSITTRIRYSQVRLTGHDFLDIGTGGFTDTNYPNAPLNDPIPANETVGNNGGRVFFTSTDQDGNFRVGDLFAIEQSTGIATLNADAFNISGLQELNLGNVTLGGGSATITEFSTDPFFTADSDNIVPTQRAIKAYISAQIGGGGASLNVNSVTAGSIFISSNVITTTTSVAIKMNTTFEFRGGVTGAPLAFNYYFK